MEQDIIEILSKEDKVALSPIEINDELGFLSIEDYKKHVLTKEIKCQTQFQYRYVPAR